MSKWCGMWGSTGAAQITPTVYVWYPFSPCGASRRLHRGSHPGPFRAVWFKWTSCIWSPCGQAQIYPMWASGIWDPCGQAQSYPMWASGIWDPCGLPDGCLFSPFSLRGTQSSFAPWHPSGAHVRKSCTDLFFVFVDSGVGCN